MAELKKLSRMIHEFVVQNTANYFRNQGFKTYSTSGKVPDMFITDSDGRFYAIEVLIENSTLNMHQTVAKKIKQYNTEDIDGLYIIVPKKYKSKLMNSFADYRVVFLSFDDLEEDDFVGQL